MLKIFKDCQHLSASCAEYAWGLLIRTFCWNWAFFRAWVERKKQRLSKVLWTIAFSDLLIDQDVHRFLDFVAVAFETCFDLISYLIFCVHSSRPGAESSRLAQSFRKRGPISNVISTKSSTVLTCTYSILQYSEFLPFFYFVSMLLLFQLHAKRAFAPKEAVGLCSCVSSNLSGVSSKYQTPWFILFLYRKSMKEQEAMHKAFLNGCKCTFQLLIEDQTTPPSLTWSRLLQAVSLPSFFKWISKVSRSVDYT